MGGPAGNTVGQDGTDRLQGRTGLPSWPDVGRHRFYEAADLVESDAGVCDLAGKQLKHVPHARPNLERGQHARASSFLRDPDRVIKQDLILADMHQKRRQARQIAVKRRGEGISRVGAGEVDRGFPWHGLRHKPRVDVGLGAKRGSGRRQIGPRRHDDGTGRQRLVGVAKRHQERESEPAAGRIADQDQPCRIHA